jgi:hypothetical protein
VGVEPDRAGVGYLELHPVREPLIGREVHLVFQGERRRVASDAEGTYGKQKSSRPNGNRWVHGL